MSKATRTQTTLPSIMGLTTIGALFTVLVPLPAVAFGPWYITHWAPQPAFFGIEALRYVGMALIPIGFVVYWKGITTLGRQGVNPIPVPPITDIVRTGIFAWTRNPMYLGAITMMVGQALLFGSRSILYYALVWFGVFNLFELSFDEKVLMKQFPEVYGRYKKTVPMWIPRPPRRDQGTT
jgi:protein-S-isoprenylcysteine O-methyltransferase Ste14